MGTSRSVLIVDDDEGVRTAVAWALEADGFDVTQTGDGLSAMRTLQISSPDLMVLDLSLPGLGGLDILSRLRANEAQSGAPPLPVIILSGRDGETDRIVGLDLGADDYLVKPFSPGELAARARSVLRRCTRSDDSPPPDRGIHLDAVTREVTVDGVALEMTAKEFDLLAFMISHPRQVFARDQLLAEVWSVDPGWQSDTTVTEHFYRLRQKIEVDPRHPSHLCTVRGVGYRWVP